jgi:quinohemoprotein ethanol dehydrogenase
MQVARRLGARWLWAVIGGLTVVSAMAAGAVSPRVTQQVLNGNGPAADWPGYGRTFDQQRFSALQQINATNVKRLGLVSSFTVNDVWNVATVPLAVNGIVYFAGGFSVVHAVDAVKGKLLWTYDPKVTGRNMRLAWGSRGLALWQDKLYVGTMDGRLIALNAKTGKPVWETQTIEPGSPLYISGAPLVFNGKVLIGNGGADYAPVRGYVTTYDAETGKQLWRFYTVPGDPSKGFENKAMEMAAKTWTGEWWKYGGGGTAWNALTYDPAFNRVYIGTGNGSPWNRRIRSPGGGDNLFLCSVVALDADTGEYAWHYQTAPGEQWDFNSSQDMMLVTLPIDGKPRKLLLHAPKNGFFYVIDRETGKLVSAEKFAKVTWAERVDLATGRPVEAPNARYQNGEELMWPGSLGAHSWPPMSFSPQTGLVYLPGRDLPGYYNDKGIDTQHWRHTPADPLGLNVASADIPANAGQAWLLAWDPLRQREAWRVPLPGATSPGTMATAGGLVFQPTGGGQLVAYDARTGARLWSGELGVGSNSPPITFEAGGRQYVSVLAGWAGQTAMFGSLSAQHGWVGREHPPRLLTFALDGKATLPASAPPRRPEPLVVPEFKVDEALARRGAAVYGTIGNCALCHGGDAIAGGFAPDLRASPLVPVTPAFDAVVRGGALLSRGMPKFDDISEEDLVALQHYLRSRARASVAPAPAAAASAP